MTNDGRRCPEIRPSAEGPASAVSRLSPFVGTRDGNFGRRVTTRCERGNMGLESTKSPVRRCRSRAADRARPSRGVDVAVLQLTFAPSPRSTQDKCRTRPSGVLISSLPDPGAALLAAPFFTGGVSEAQSKKGLAVGDERAGRGIYRECVVCIVTWRRAARGDRARVARLSRGVCFSTRGQGLAWPTCFERRPIEAPTAMRPEKAPAGSRRVFDR